MRKIKLAISVYTDFAYLQYKPPVPKTRSVLARIRNVKQPPNGYVSRKQFQEIKFDDGLKIKEGNISSNFMHTVVNYLTRYMSGVPVPEAFKISYLGYTRRIEFKSYPKEKANLMKIKAMENKYFGYDEEVEIVTEEEESALKEEKKEIIKSNLKFDDDTKIGFKYLSEQITGLDDASIIAACKLCTYDIWFRNLNGVISSPVASDINPDQRSIESIRIMVKRTLKFFDKYGPIIVSGFDFKPNGYTRIINSGDGDYLTKDTLWDLKSIKIPISSQHTLRVVIYWIMGKHSGNEKFENINKIGIFNPRLNIAYILETSQIPKETIKKTEEDVICY